MSPQPVGPDMGTQYDAVCTEHKATNGRHYMKFDVDGPSDAPDEFSYQPSPTEYGRLAEHSAESDGVGRVPAVYDDGWAIDWAGLDESDSGDNHEQA